jgi:hypothetical protein
MIANKLRQWRYYESKIPQYLSNDNGFVSQIKLFYNLLLTCDDFYYFMLKAFDINDTLYDSTINVSESNFEYIDFINGIYNYKQKSLDLYKSALNFTDDLYKYEKSYYDTLVSNESDFEYIENYANTSMKYGLIEKDVYKDEFNNTIDSYYQIDYDPEDSIYKFNETYSDILDKIGKLYNISRIVTLRRLDNDPGTYDDPNYEKISEPMVCGDSITPSNTLICGTSIITEDKTWHTVRLNNFNYLKLIKFKMIENNYHGTREELESLYKSVGLPIILFNNEIDSTITAYFELKYIDNPTDPYYVNYVDKLLFLNGYYDISMLGITTIHYANYNDKLDCWSKLVNENEYKYGYINDYTSILGNNTISIWSDCQNESEFVTKSNNHSNAQTTDLQYDNIVNDSLNPSTEDLMIMWAHWQE